MTCFTLRAMGLGPKFVISALRVPHCVVCTLRCDLLFGLRFFLFPSLVPFLGVFHLFLSLQEVVQIH